MIPADRGENQDPTPSRRPLSCDTRRNVLKRDEKREALPQTSLPGVLDHREFTRVGTDLGRCDVCAGGRAVHRSGDGRVVLCEGCFARLVREWNGGKGVSG